MLEAPHHKPNFTQAQLSSISVPSQKQMNSFRGTMLKSVAHSPSHHQNQPTAREAATFQLRNIRDQELKADLRKKKDNNSRGPAEFSINPFHLQTQTDGFMRSSGAKITHAGGYSGKYLQRKPSDKIPALPNINRYPSRPRISQYSPKFIDNYGKRFLEKQRGSKDMSSHTPSVKIIETYNGQRQTAKRSRPEGMLSYGEKKGEELRLKPKTPSEVYGPSKTVMQYSYRNNMTPQTRVEKMNKLTARPLRNPNPSNHNRVGRQIL